MLMDLTSASATSDQMNKMTRMTAATTRPASPMAHNTQPCTKIKGKQIKSHARAIDWITTRAVVQKEKGKK
jgi:hypothetical protein